MTGFVVQGQIWNVTHEIHPYEVLLYRHKQLLSYYIVS